MLFRKRLTAILTALTLFLAAPPSRVAASDNVTVDDEVFYKKLVELIVSQDDSVYFSEMTLSIGSNILTVDGESQILDAAPEIEGNRTMLPLRAVAEAAGATVNYDSASHSALITSCNGDKIACPIGTNIMTVNGRNYTLDVSSYVKDGRTFLPVRAVSEVLELDVAWDQATASVTITAPYQSARLLVFAGADFAAGSLDAETALYDGSGMWVLQFRTAAEAKATAGRLKTRGVECQPDLYIASLEREVSDGTINYVAPHNSWGVEECGFDRFLSCCSFDSSLTETVAVVDSGVDATHPFLNGRTLRGYDFIDDDENPYDENGHGTHVASIVVDCAGSAPVSILPVRVLGKDGSGFSSVISTGIKYAALRADVINLSLGGPHDEAKDHAVQYAISNGCIVTIAAGNDNADTSEHCPAHITTPGAVVVSAGDSNRRKADFTNYGASVDLMAPGIAVIGAVPGGNYALKHGTSMAAPHAAAAAALLDLAWDKSLSPADLEKKLYTATSNGSRTNDYSGYGFLDMTGASIPEPARTPPTLAVSPDPEAPVIPSAPGNLNAVWITKYWSADVSWSASENASYYEVEYSHDGTDWKPDPYYRDRSAIRFTSEGVGYSGYGFRVRAVNEAGASDWNAIIMDKQDRIDTPTNLKVSWVERNWSSVVSWDAVSNASSYEVEYSHDGTDWKPDPDYHGGTSYTSFGVGYSGYHFRVRGENGGMVSEWATVIQDQPSAVPTGLTAKWNADNWSAVVTWIPASGAVSYEVEYSHDGTDWKLDPDYRSGTWYISWGVGYSGYQFRTRAIYPDRKSEWIETVCR